MKYIINEDKKVVVAIIEETKYDVINYIKANYKEPVNFGNMYDKLLLNETYKGIARCHPDDKFDAEKGKMIARARAIYKHDLAFNKAVKKYFDIKTAILKKIKKHSNEKLIDATKKKEEAVK